eukprot:UC4_evm1s457
MMTMRRSASASQERCDLFLYKHFSSGYSTVGALAQSQNQSQLVAGSNSQLQARPAGFGLTNIMSDNFKLVAASNPGNAAASVKLKNSEDNVAPALVPLSLAQVGNKDDYLNAVAAANTSFPNIRFECTFNGKPFSFKNYEVIQPTGEDVHLKGEWIELTLDENGKVSELHMRPGGLFEALYEAAAISSKNQSSAATLIQSQFRGHSVRKEQQEQEAALLSILQSAFKGPISTREQQAILDYVNDEDMQLLQSAVLRDVHSLVENNPRFAAEVIANLPLPDWVTACDALANQLPTIKIVTVMRALLEESHEKPTMVVPKSTEPIGANIVVASKYSQKTLVRRKSTGTKNIIKRPSSTFLDYANKAINAIDSISNDIVKKPLVDEISIYLRQLVQFGRLTRSNPAGISLLRRIDLFCEQNGTMGKNMSILASYVNTAIAVRAKAAQHEPKLNSTNEDLWSSKFEKNIKPAYWQPSSQFLDTLRHNNRKDVQDREAEHYKRLEEARVKVEKARKSKLEAIEIKNKMWLEEKVKFASDKAEALRKKQLQLHDDAAAREYKKRALLIKFDARAGYEAARTMARHQAKKSREVDEGEKVNLIVNDVKEGEEQSLEQAVIALKKSTIQAIKIAEDRAMMAQKSYESASAEVADYDKERELAQAETEGSAALKIQEEYRAFRVRKERNQRTESIRLANEKDQQLRWENRTKADGHVTAKLDKDFANIMNINDEVEVKKLIKPKVKYVKPDIDKDGNFETVEESQSVVKEEKSPKISANEVVDEPVDVEFKAWLVKYASSSGADKKDPVVKLGNLSMKDDNFPEHGTVIDYVKYFKNNKAPPTIIHALEAAFAKFAPFKSWLSDVGSDPEVSADIKKFGALVSKDTDFPDQGTMDDYMSYLTAKGAPQKVKQILRESFGSNNIISTLEIILIPVKNGSKCYLLRQHITYNNINNQACASDQIA